MTLAEILPRLTAVDIVLVEGNKREASLPNIHVHRKAAGLAAPVQTPSVVAVATDDEMLELPEGVARLDVDSPAAVANFVISLKANRDYL